jgi:hypothetical protein
MIGAGNDRPIGNSRHLTGTRKHPQCDDREEYAPQEGAEQPERRFRSGRRGIEGRGHRLLLLA